jgi:hypothetical protein
MGLVEVGLGDVDLIGLAQDRDRWRALVNSVLNLRVPSNAGKLSSACTSDYVALNGKMASEGCVLRDVDSSSGGLV